MQSKSLVTLIFLLFVMENTVGWASVCSNPAKPCRLQGSSQLLGRRVSPSSKLKTLMVIEDNNTVDTDIEDDDEDGYGFDEETARNPSAEIERLKAKIEVAKEEGDMDTVMTLMGTLLALGGGYESES